MDTVCGRTVIIHAQVQCKHVICQLKIVENVFCLLEDALV